MKRKRWRILAPFEANVWLNKSWEDSGRMVNNGQICCFLSTCVSVCLSSSAGHSYTHTHTRELCPTCLAAQPSRHRIWQKRTTEEAWILHHMQQKPSSVAEERAAVPKVSAGSGGPALSWSSVYRWNFPSLHPCLRPQRMQVQGWRSLLKRFPASSRWAVHTKTRLVSRRECPGHTTACSDRSVWTNIVWDC